MKNLYKNPARHSNKTLDYLGMALYRAAGNTASEELCKKFEEAIKENVRKIEKNNESLESVEH